MLALLLFLTVCLVLMAGYPVALSLAGTALAFALLGQLGVENAVKFLNGERAGEVFNLREGRTVIGRQVG